MEGTIVKWTKKTNELVERNENIVLISTDKVEVEIPSPLKGYLKDLKYDEGDVVPVGEILGYIDSDNVSDNIDDQDNADTKKVAENIKAVKPVDLNKFDSQEQSVGKKFLSPLIKKLVKKFNINISELSSIQGSGRNERITKTDILSFMENKTANQSNDSPERQKDYLTINNDMGESSLEGKDISNIRRTIMKNMLKSREVSAHVSTFFKVNYTKIDKYKAQYKLDNPEFPITYTSFISLAVVETLKKHPYINAEVKGNKIIFKKTINLGIAVAIKDPEPSLIVPVIKNAENLNIIGISREIIALSSKAKSRKITLSDIQEGSFTITNPGNFGAIIGIPIINQPQLAILCVGSISKEPVVTSNEGVDSISICKMGWICLSFDHRIIDGATADAFMSDLKWKLENWS
jgi:2-oxoglutarate dehydrogenase E2 component (dihydrolipoamide succinyltransferase)